MNTRLISIISTSVAVFLAVLLLTRGCDKPTTKPDDSEAWRERVSELNFHIQVRDARIDSLQRLVAALKIDRSSDSSRLTKAVQTISRSYSRAKAEVQHLRDSIPEVNALVVAADSLIAAKDSLYGQEVSHRYMAEKLYEQTIAELGAKNVRQQQISQLLETKVVDLENQNGKLSKKLDRKRTGNRVLLGIGAGLAAAVGILTLTQ